MFKSRKTITIQFQTWQQLLKIKAETGKRSLDQVINELIKNGRRNNQTNN